MESLLPAARVELGPHPTKTTVFALEQAVQDAVADTLVNEVLVGDVGLHEILTNAFLRDLRRQLYSGIWSWAGRFRIHEMSIGVAPEAINMDLRNSLETLLYRWRHTNDWSARELGIVAHAETVRVHPFVDGNGRTSRLLADLVFLSAQSDQAPFAYSWDIDRQTYIRLLGEYDIHRNPRPLAELIPIVPLSNEDT